MAVASRRRLRRRRKPDDLATQARRDVRSKTPEQLWQWMVAQSVDRQTIPLPWLVAALEYLSERRGKTQEELFVELRQEVFMLSGHDMPLESARRGPLG